VGAGSRTRLTADRLGNVDGRLSAGTGRTMPAMMQMSKLDVAKLKAAYAGE
jgi:hypothetical protein